MPAYTRCTSGASHFGKPQTQKGNMKATITLTLPDAFDELANKLAQQSLDVCKVDDELRQLLLDDAQVLLANAVADGTGSIEFENN